MAGTVAHPTVEWCRIENNGRLAMNGLRCRFNSAGYRLSLDGAIGHLPRLEGLDLQFDAAGDRIIQMLPWSDQESTLNGDFTARGHLRGTMTDPHLDPVNFSAELDEARLEIEGTVSDIPDGGRLDARITIDANELAAVGEGVAVVSVQAGVFLVARRQCNDLAAVLQQG